MALDWIAGVPFLARARDFSHLHSVHTGSGVHRPCIQWVAEALSSGLKYLDHEVDYSPPSAHSTEVKNGGTVLLLLYVSPWHGA
jgi:hypothetical protein